MPLCRILADNGERKMRGERIGECPKILGMKRTRMDKMQAARARPWQQQAKKDDDMNC